MIPLSRVKPNGKVDLWDLGPQVAPKPPAAPEEPDKGKLKGAELAAAEVAYEDAVAAYKASLRDWNERRAHHRAWHAENGGPKKVELWGADARHAMEIEGDRYKLDLPKGQKPGQAQIEAEERAAAELEALKRAQSLDPQFGAGAAA